MKFINPNNNICCNDVIQCVFDLNDLDINTYKKLKEKKELQATELADILKKERSTVYRSLQRLVCCGLCNKETKTLEKGGYFHVYSPITKKETKKKINKCIDDWYKKMKDTIKTLES